MTDIVIHLRACRDDFAARARHPVVAWDCLGAAAWAKTCDGLADEIEALGLEGDQALEFLQARAHDARTRADTAIRSGVGLLVSMDAHTRFDEIIDPIARERRGWIELSGHAEHFGREGIEGMPTYRRMLGVNRCVATLSRRWKEERPSRFRTTSSPSRPCWVEAEEEWEARRRAWLSRYHPGILVIHKDGGVVRHDGTAAGAGYTPIHGTVAEHAMTPTPTTMPFAFGSTSQVPRTKELAA